MSVKPLQYLRRNDLVAGTVLDLIAAVVVVIADAPGEEMDGDGTQDDKKNDPKTQANDDFHGQQIVTSGALLLQCRRVLGAAVTER